MAGFDFYVKYADDTQGPLRAILGKLQRTCRTYDLQVHFANERGPSQFHVTVDGPLPMMQTSSIALLTILPAFADGQASAADRRRRLGLADRVTGAYWAGVLRIGEMVHDVTSRLGGVPNSFFFDVEQHDPVLGERMWALSQTLVAYMNGQVGPAQILEEVHTGLEWLLQETVGRPSARKMSYAQMVEQVLKDGLIDDASSVGVLSMKDLRRDAKHRGVPVGRLQVDNVLETAVEVCHRLLTHLAARSSGEPGNGPGAV